MRGFQNKPLSVQLKEAEVMAIKSSGELMEIGKKSERDRILKLIDKEISKLRKEHKNIFEELKQKIKAVDK